MSASGEAWVAGYGTKALGPESVIYYRTAGNVARLPDRLLPIDPPQVVYPPMPEPQRHLVRLYLCWKSKATESNSSGRRDPPRACRSSSMRAITRTPNSPPRSCRPSGTSSPNN